MELRINEFGRLGDAKVEETQGVRGEVGFRSCRDSPTRASNHSPKLRLPIQNIMHLKQT